MFMKISIWIDSRDQANLADTIIRSKSAKLMDLSGEVENDSSISTTCTTRSPIEWDKGNQYRQYNIQVEWRI